MSAQRLESGAMANAETTDRIERSIVIDAPRARVWHALTDAKAFGTWFGVDLAGHAFAPGARVRTPMKSCGHEDVDFDVTVERIEPQSFFSYRWHPYAVDPSLDYATEEPTRVAFTLADAPNGATRVTVVESGFDRIPPGRRLEAFTRNGNGWTAQLANLARHVVAP